MTRATVAQTTRRGAEAGRALGAAMQENLGGERPHALVVFASPDQDLAAMLEALRAACSPDVLVGCSSAGEFTHENAGAGSTVALGLHATGMRFNASLGRGLRENRGAAAEQIVDGFTGVEAEPGYRFRSALVLADALAGFTDDLVDRLTVLTGGTYRFFGGGAGDDGRFEKTYVFCGDAIETDAAVALEILSQKPVGIGVRHGWTPAGERMRITAADGMLLGSLNAVPAAEVFADHAQATAQAFDATDPMPFFLHNVLGLESPGGFRLRVPLAVAENGAVSCASNVPAGAVSCIMGTTAASAADAAAEATRSALAQMDGAAPAVGLVFDCVATRLRLGHGFGDELDAVRRELGDVPFAGFNTYGQIAKAEGQFSGFHNCTAVVCLLPN